MRLFAKCGLQTRDEGLLLASVRRAFGWATQYWIGGISPLWIFSINSSNSPGLLPQSEKLNVWRPSITSNAISQEAGAMLLYQGHSVSLLWHWKSCTRIDPPSGRKARRGRDNPERRPQGRLFYSAHMRTSPMGNRYALS